MSETRAPLEYRNETTAGRIIEAGMWFFVAAVCILFTLPFWQSKGDKYPWGFSAVAWAVAAVVTVAGVAQLKHQSGVTFDRGKGVLILWSTPFGRRKERRVPLSGFAEVGVQTWVQKASRSWVESRYYAVELRGSKQCERLGSYRLVNRAENIRAIVEYLKMPLKVDDREPGRQPASEL